MSHNFFIFFYHTHTFYSEGNYPGTKHAGPVCKHVFYAVKLLFQHGRIWGLTPFGGSLQCHQEELQLA